MDTNFEQATLDNVNMSRANLANRRLREKLTEACDEKGVGLSVPSPILCTDNGAMIGVAGAHWLSDGQYSSWGSNAEPGMRLG